MKYIIPQDKLDNVVFKYLDLNLRNLEKRKAKFYKGIVYGFPDEEDAILGYRNDGILYVYYELIEEISNGFGLKDSDSKSIIGRWVSDRLQLDVMNTLRSVECKRGIC
jgi:hypothetical protein